MFEFIIVTEKLVDLLSKGGGLSLLNLCYVKVSQTVVGHGVGFERGKNATGRL